MLYYAIMVFVAKTAQVFPKQATIAKGDGGRRAYERANPGRVIIITTVYPNLVLTSLASRDRNYFA